MTINCLIIASKPSYGREVIAKLADRGHIDVKVGFKQCVLAVQCYAATNPS